LLALYPTAYRPNRARSQSRAAAIHVAVAKHYVENLKEEVKKGMREKAEEGIYLFA